MSADTMLWFAGIAFEAILVATLLWKRAFRQFPVFCLYIALDVLMDSSMMAISRFYPQRYFRAILIEMSVDSLLQFGVLTELAWSVIRPYRASLPRATIFVLASVVLLAGAAAWPITGTFALPGPSPEWHLLFRLQQTFAILRILAFVLLAAFSQFLAISLKDRELQIATGLGFYSLVSLGAAVLHTHSESPALYHGVDQLVAASYLGSLLYWVYSFLQQEAPRQEFSPRMQSLLLSVAGAARADRLTVEEIRKSSRR